MDHLKEFLKGILTQEHCEMCCARLEPPPEKVDTTIFQELANKVKEQGKVLEQVEHHRNVVRDVDAKLHKQQGVLQEFLARNQILVATRD